MPQADFSFDYKGRPFQIVVPDAPDHIVNSIVASNSFYEVELLEVLARYLSGGDLVVDAGANIGNHAIYFAGVCGCRVLAFEPVENVFALLESNVELNALRANVELNRIALGAVRGTAVIRESIPGNLGGTSLRMDARGEMEVSTLDEEVGDRDVRLIKIDVEGMDVDVLRGARQVIFRSRPWIVCEAKTRGEYQAVCSELEQHGYQAVACYNATDTYVFLPARTESERERLRQEGFELIVDLQRETRWLRGDIRRSDRYSERIVGQVKQELAQARSALGHGLEAAAGQLAQLQSIVDSEVAATRQSVAELRSELLEERGDAARRLEAAKEQSSKHADQLIHDVQDRLLDTQSQLRVDLARADMRIDAIESSIAEVVEAKRAKLAELYSELSSRHDITRKELEAALCGLGRHVERVTAEASNKVLEEQATLAEALERAMTRSRKVEQRLEDWVAAGRADVDRVRAELAEARERAARDLQESCASVTQRVESVASEREARLLGLIRETAQQAERSNQSLADLRRALVASEEASRARSSTLEQELAVALDGARRGLLEAVSEVRCRVGQVEEAASSKLQAASEALVRAIDRTSNRLDDLESSSSSAIQSLNAMISDLGARLAKADGDSQAMLGALARQLELERRVLADRLDEEARSALGRFETEQHYTRSRFDGIEALLRGWKSHSLALRIDVQNLQQDAAEKQGRLAGLAGEVENVRSEMVEMSEALAAQQAKQGEKIEGAILSVAGELAKQGQQTQDLTNRLLASEQQGATLRSQLSDAETQLNAARAQLGASKAELDLITDSISFKLGNALVLACKSPSRLVTLPAALWRIWGQLRQRRAKVEAPTEVPVEQIIEVAQQEAAEASPPPVPGTPVQPPEGRFEMLDGRPFAPSKLVLEPASCEDLAVSELKALRVAAVMDEFTCSSYFPECQLLQLTPAEWEAELEAFKPQLLFIESAWRGKDELWGSKVGHCSREVQGIIAWCRQNGVPTVFWNKEDPVHFETFLNTAKLFDYVFTTDIDCIQRYKAALGHERVFLLPFAAQPRVNNPIELYERKDAFCFAGAYYVRYPDRTRDLEDYVASLPAFKPLDIYDRNFGKTDPNYQFPEQFKPLIVGNLPFSQIDKAYKGYKYAINLNSIKQSQSMFARRVYELLASNTITVSNYSRGVRLLFGDLIVTTDSGEEAVRRLREVANDEPSSRKLRLAGLRKVMSEHTYQDRLAYVVSKVSGRQVALCLPTVTAIGYARNERELDRLQDAYRRQTHDKKRLVVVLAKGLVPECDATPADVRMISAADAKALRLGDVVGKGEWLAGMVANDYYGPNYLYDMALAMRYSDAQVIGKVAHYEMAKPGKVTLRGAGQAYRPVASVPARAGMAMGTRDQRLRLLGWAEKLASRRFEDASALAIDEFNYCRDALKHAGAAEVCGLVDDQSGLDCGLPVAELLREAASIGAQKVQGEDTALTAEQLGQLFGNPPKASQVEMGVEQRKLKVYSRLPEGKHEYWYANRDHAPAELNAHEGTLRFFLDASAGLNVQLAILFLDTAGQRLGSAVKSANRNHEVAIPEGTARLRLGLRIYGSGAVDISKLLLQHRSLDPSKLLARGEHLVLTNHYPSAGDLYRNGFVHRRVVSYRKAGVRTDVFRFRPGEPISYHEFEDVDCITGSEEALDRLLAAGQHRTVLVHFLDEAMWQVLKKHIDRVRVIVWVHGAEIQPLHRREYNYSNEKERAAAQVVSDKRTAFWRGLLRSMHQNLHLVFVSKYLANAVMEDLGFELAEAQYSVIHNPIDTSLFGYVEKTAEHRLRILSIRPYASRTYANDLSVQAILELSEKPCFPSLQFKLIGDGALFEETVAPLAGLPNVTIERRFLSQTQISQLHRGYGVFLCPTRMDTQGVSRDEAMSSGLVPVTNAVAAVPEFVDEACGILAPAEDALAIALGIERIVSDPAFFLAMSKAAATRVAANCSLEKTSAREVRLICEGATKCV